MENLSNMDTIMARKWAVEKVLDTLRHVMAVTGEAVEVDAEKIIGQATKLENYVLGTTPEPVDGQTVQDSPIVAGPVQAAPAAPAPAPATP